jgi:MOSC domain-containing protein YiiM
LNWKKIMRGIVEEIYIAPEGGSKMVKVDEIEAIANLGLKGDRYLKRTGYWSGVDECQVTLIERETLELIASESDIRVSNGEHRRNLVTSGIRLHDLAGKRFAIGEAVLEYDQPRPPCGYIQSITQHGMTRALRGARGGICARVVKSGVIRVNDTIEVI